MRPVTRDEFFRAMNLLNVHPTITNDRWPYTSDWLVGRTIVGRTVGRLEGQVALKDYYLAGGSE